ncbi:hypothetical protein GGR54DRAFT_243459 [Hypoxylon sp. NC1633]|nr:hypothetical protein GGR54DRAFT_243459 [Hypoxylon sp. NC1633]
MDPVNSGSQDPKVVFVPDGDRPMIRKYPDEPEFRPNDEVYIKSTGTTERQGPFVVLSVEDKTYKLGDTSGKPIQDGKDFEENDLELKDPFE